MDGIGPIGSSPIDLRLPPTLYRRWLPGPSPAEQAANAIRIVGDFTSRKGERLERLPPDLYALIGAPSPTMAAELAIELVQRGLLDGVQAPPDELLNVGLTLDGWERYEAEKRGRFAGNYGFIAMQFDDTVLDRLMEGVKPIVRDQLGYELVDMRELTQAGIIDNIMRTQIRDAAFVIADLTHENSGAYWEAGYAEGLGKQVIYICERDKFDQAGTHFDTNHCTTLPWSADNCEDFGEALVATLRRSLDLIPGAS